ncbi:hypothetical protein FS749_005019 [Ceratobasidium sp. UAMH 11750]|nr:hypothetical protein FS749_005019 [Ceratobasidium sp. UAMH 11750]
MSSLSTHTQDQDNIYAGHPQLTPLEADVLWEYAKLARTLKAVRLHSPRFARLQNPRAAPSHLHTPTPNRLNIYSFSRLQLVAKSREMSERSDDALLAKLRAAEIKMGLVHTLFKASVWAVLVKQEEEFNEEGETTFQP